MDVYMTPAQRGRVRREGFYGRFRKGSGELKFKDATLISTAIANTGTILYDSINKIAEGTGPDERIGRKCNMRMVQLRMRLVLVGDDTAAETWDNVRLIVYQDRQCNGAAATVGTILESTDYWAFRNLEYSLRYRTLFDKSYSLRAQAGAYTGAAAAFSNDTKHINIFRKVWIPLEFSGANGDLADIRSNNVGVMAISTNQRTSIQGTVRIRFME